METIEHTDDPIAARADALLADHRDATWRRTDRLFAALVACQWLAGIAAALWISPRTWTGPYAQAPVHVWAAVVLGAAISSVPICLALVRPGRASTRHVIAVGQACTSALLIHLGGGRIETHFHVFGSVAFLAFYRDWRVLVTYSVVVAADHFLRGLFWPQSIYGVLATSHWRWLEHAGWVVFADLFLVRSCLRSTAEMEAIALRQARLEALNDSVEREVEMRTAELRLSEERFRLLSASSPIGIFQCDAAGQCTYTNARWQEIAGLSLRQSLGMGWTEAVHPNDREACMAAWKAGVRERRSIAIEFRMQRPNGEVRWVQACTTPTFDGDAVVCHVGTIDDVTARREVEQETRQAQKLEAVGQLAAGIAHEINTPIQFVGDNTRFLQDAFGDLRTAIGKCEAVVAAAEAGPVDPALLREVRQTLETADVPYLAEEVPKALAQTLEGVKRVATIVRAMKDFAHADTGEKLPADLNAALDSTITVARNELKYVADVETDFGTLPAVECQLGELNQVFLNLLINAAHAIGDVVKGTTARGTIRVRTRHEGDTVLVAIGDTGAGIPEEIRAKVFDPFFTTKEVGRGSGQGLAIARAIVIDKHGGALTFESELGRGTTFFIRLPVTAPAALKPEPHPPESAHAVG